MAPKVDDNDIAIIGMSCRTAGANSPSELWDLLANSRDVQTEITRFNSKGFYHPEGAPRKGLTNVKDAYMLDDNVIDKFDNAFFYTTPHEAVAMDPQQRMLLEVVYEAIENAGIPLDDFVGTDTAVYAGMEGCDYHTILARDLNATPRYLATGTATCMAANRLSYFFDLSGPSMSVDTACSSTMAALHQAVRILQHGDSKMAMVCGAKLILNPDMFMPSSELGFLSPSGKCQSFDAAGDGYGRSEGVLAVLLKPLKTAIADGDAVRSVIKGTRLNQDGRTQGITLPSAKAQQRNMQALYRELGITPNEIQYVEAHGTGTAAGDPIEFTALNSVFRPASTSREALVVGSVKSNIGHLEACSALGSIVKVTECLERGAITSQMHFNDPNPKIDFHNIVIPTTTIPWPKAESGVRRAAINTFGAGGTNGHAVLESYPHIPSKPSESSERPLLFKVSAADESSLKATCERYAEYVDKTRPNIYDLAHTLLSRRSTLRKSICFTGKTLNEVISNLKSETLNFQTKDSIGDKKILFVFTGQGAQWAQMGKALLEYSPLFRKTINECDNILAGLSDKPSWSIVEELQKGPDGTHIHKAEYSQPLCTALQLGLVTLLDSWGLKPDVVVGHSSGEIAAAYAGGLMSMSDAITNSYYRGLVLSESVMKSDNRVARGSMCAIGLSQEKAVELLSDFPDRVQLAAVNSPTSCTLSGDKDAIEEIVAICQTRGHFCRKLRVDVAYHSYHMIPVAKKYKQALSRTTASSRTDGNTCQMFSSVTGKRIAFEDCTPEYWSRNMTSTVRFCPAIESCFADCPKMGATIEIGPHPALKGPVTETFRGLGKKDLGYLHTCSRGNDDFEAILNSAGSMIPRGIPLKLQNINARVITDESECEFERGKVLTDLPTYQWNHTTSFWSESRVSRNVRFRQYPRHQLLGSRYVDDIPQRPCWRNHLILKEIPWLAQMRDEGTAEFPPAAYLLMALEAAHQTFDAAQDNTSLHLTNIHFEKEFSLERLAGPDVSVEIQLLAKRNAVEGTFDFEILSLSESADKQVLQWTRHCSGKFAQQSSITPSHIPPTVNGSSDADLETADTPVMDQYGRNLSRVKKTSQGVKGQFSQLPYPHENYLIDPRVLHDILSLPSKFMVDRSLPATYRLRTIKSLQVQSFGTTCEEGEFDMKIEPVPPYSVRTSIDTEQGKTHFHLTGILHQANRLLAQKPKMESLFFKPVSLPDLTFYHDPEHEISLSRYIELLTHKWPMCDVKIVGISSKSTVNTILEIFQVHREDRRRLMRCIYLEKCSDVTLKTDNVQLVDESQAQPQYHMIFVENGSNLDLLHQQLLPQGFMCLLAGTAIDDSQLHRNFKPVCDLNHHEQKFGQLWRKEDSIRSIHSDTRTVLFAEPKSRVGPDVVGVSAESVPLEPASVVDFCHNYRSTRFNAIIIDAPEKSIIASWSGKDLVPWLQTFLKHADSILWVTQQDSSSPFQKLAGILLRTLQAEQPSLKVCWFVYSKERRGELGEESFEQDLLSARSSMLEGQNEIKLDFNSQDPPYILRYYPDDELSVATGTTEPRKILGPLDHTDYELSFAAPQQPVILSKIPDLFPHSTQNEVEIDVETSVIGHRDAIAFEGYAYDATWTQEPNFLAGVVRHDPEGRFSPGTRIVGWSKEAHKNRLCVPHTQLFLCTKANSTQEAASVFAAVAVATYIIDEVTRARQGDRFDLQLNGVLHDTLRQICKRIGALIIDPAEATKADFVVTYDVQKGVQVNARSLDITKYLESGRGRDEIQKNYQSCTQLSTPSIEYSIADFSDAVRNARDNPYSTTISHNTTLRKVEHVPIYNPQSTLFSPTANYVLIGGLGGLGRFICTWMVEHGAKQLNVISRSGLTTPGAQSTHTTITSTGATLSAFQADACDRPTMRSILSTIRSKAPIKGIINLAMILGDAPMASMTGEEWDRALRVKIDSSWILHEETLGDELEHFVLFSSIASVCGNRNQGNYNVANGFLNALAEYRLRVGRCGVSVALGAMTDMGVLYNLSKPNMLDVLTRSGLSHLTQKELAKIMEAAILVSPRHDHPLLLTGLEMFSRDTNNQLLGRKDPLFWTELPEFSHLQSYLPPLTSLSSSSPSSSSSSSSLPLKTQIKHLLDKDAGDDAGVKRVVKEGFLGFLAQLSGFEKEHLDAGRDVGTYGVDSLSGVGCQYWFWRELEVDIPVLHILGGATIEGIVGEVCKGLETKRGKVT